MRHSLTSFLRKQESQQTPRNSRLCGNGLLLALFLAFSFVTGPAFAAREPRPLLSDHRVRTVIYQKDEVVKFLGHYGYQSSIEFAVWTVFRGRFGALPRPSMLPDRNLNSASGASRRLASSSPAKRVSRAEASVAWTPNGACIAIV